MEELGFKIVKTHPAGDEPIARAELIKRRRKLFLDPLMLLARRKNLS